MRMIQNANRLSTYDTIIEKRRMLQIKSYNIIDLITKLKIHIFLIAIKKVSFLQSYHVSDESILQYLIILFHLINYVITLTVTSCKEECENNKEIPRHFARVKSVVRLKLLYDQRQQSKRLNLISHAIICLIYS